MVRADVASPRKRLFQQVPIYVEGRGEEVAEKT